MSAIENSDGILNVDGFNWSVLGASGSSPATISKYHKYLRCWIERAGGSIWLTQGDCGIASNFPSIDSAVDAAKAVQKHFLEFNQHENELGFPLTLRIGVSLGTVPQDIPKEHRGEAAATALDEAGHLQKTCPPGRIRISKQVFDRLMWGQGEFRPTVDDETKAMSKDSLVWIERSLLPDELEHRKRLTRRQQRCYPIQSVPKPLLFRSGKGLTDLQDIVSESLVIVGETRTEGEGDLAINHPAPTSDAVGVVEILAACQAAPNVCAGVDEWEDTTDLAWRTSLVIIGSPIVNLYAYALNTMSDTGFVVEDNGLLRIVVKDQKGTATFPSKDEHAKTHRHYGLVLVGKNPTNLRHDCVWIAGISGIATHAAARFVRDMILNPTSTLNRYAAHHDVSSPNIAIVVPKATADWGRAHISGGLWRVEDYGVVRLGRQE